MWRQNRESTAARLVGQLEGARDVEEQGKGRPHRAGVTRHTSNPLGAAEPPAPAEVSSGRTPGEMSDLQAVDPSLWVHEPTCARNFDHCRCHCHSDLPPSGSECTRWYGEYRSMPNRPELHQGDSGATEWAHGDCELTPEHEKPPQVTRYEPICAILEPLERLGELR